MAKKPKPLDVEALKSFFRRIDMALSGGRILTAQNWQKLHELTDDMQGQTQVLALRHLNLFAPSDMFEVTARISRVLALFTILCCPAWSQTAIVGVFRYPNAVAVNGKVEINLQRGAAKNNCVTPAHIMRFPPVVRRITNGTLATLNLYATSCLSPAEPYTVRVFDQNNTLLYHTRWTVPNQASVNIVNIDTR